MLYSFIPPAFVDWNQLPPILQAPRWRNCFKRIYTSSNLLSSAVFQLRFWPWYFVIRCVALFFEVSPTPRINKYVDKQGRYPLTTLPNVLGGQLWLEIANPALADELFLRRLVFCCCFSFAPLAYRPRFFLVYFLVLLRVQEKDCWLRWKQKQQKTKERDVNREPQERRR